MCKDLLLSKSSATASAFAAIVSVGLEYIYKCLKASGLGRAGSTAYRGIVWNHTF